LVEAIVISEIFHVKAFNPSFNPNPGQTKAQPPEEVGLEVHLSHPLEE
jgi:hypothetical protein